MRRYLKQAIFGRRVFCSHCGSYSLQVIKQEERWRCRRCRKPFSIKSSCWLKGSKLSLETIWMLLWCWQKKISVIQTQAIIGLSYPTVFNWYKKFRDHIPKERMDTLLKDNIVMDEMFTRDNCIIGAKQKGTRNIVLRVLHEKHPQKHHAVDFLLQFAQSNSNLFTDGGGIYKGIGNWHHLKHQYELHKKFEFSLTAEIEGLWGVFRTFVRRMYHHVTTYKLEDVVKEFCLRFRRDEIFDNPLNYWNSCLSLKPFAL